MGLDKFSSSLDLLLGFNVNLYIGEDIYNGKLIGIETDHIIMEDENNFVSYYSTEQIQAITKNTKLFQSEEITTNFLKTQSLTEVLNSFRHSWVSILCLNKQKFNGILSQVDEDFVTLINGEERILIKLTHVSNILKGFIEDNAGKNSSSNENEKNDKDSDNKKDSNVKSSSSGDKDDSKKDDSKKDEKSKSESKESGKSSEKKQKNSSHEEKSAKKQAEAVKEEFVEPNNTMVWSQPIKIEATMIQTKDEVSSNTVKAKKPHVEEVKSEKISTDMENPSNEKEKKSDEPKSSKTKSNDHEKEMKQVKEVSMQKTDNNPAPPFQLQKVEVKSTKTRETAKAAKSAATQTQAAKKTEKQADDTNMNNKNQNVWKQKEQEQKVFRFAGEPVNRDNQRAFPFAGWPNRNNRTSTF